MLTAVALTALAGVAVASPASAEDTPRHGGVFNYVAPFGDSVSTLDPTRSTRTQDFLLGFGLHCMLYRWSADQRKPVPDLAERIELQPDGVTSIVHLRANALFHNGRPVTAADLIWSYTHEVDPSQGLSGARYIRGIKGAAEFAAGKASGISGLREIDDHTLSMTMTDTADPGYLLFWPATAILPREEVEGRGDRFGIDPIGCGPFQLDEWVRGSHVTLKRFPDYYIQGRPYLDKIVYNIMGEPAARDLAFRAGQLDATTISPAQIDSYRQNPQRGTLLEAVVDYTRHMGFNPNFAPFKDIRVRQALNYAVDRDLIIDKLLKHQAEPATSWLPATSDAFDPQLHPYPYDPQKAKALLVAAGYDKGFTLEVLTNSDKEYGGAIVEAMRSFLRPLNIILQPRIVDNAVAVDVMFRTGAFDAYMWSYSSGPDPLVAAERFLSKTPRTAGNAIAYNNPDYDRAVNAAAAALNDADRISKLREANAILLQDAPMWFFNYAKGAIAYKPWVHGLQPSSVQIAYQYPDLIWLDDVPHQAASR